jgi:FKBP-type peptidyl-prolyl cis-trans isomerase
MVLFSRVSLTFILITAFAVFGAACDGGSQRVKLETQTDIVSYKMGVDNARYFKDIEVDLNPDAVRMGMVDVLNDKELALPDSVLQQAMTDFNQMRMEKEMQQRQQQTQDNLIEAQQAYTQNLDADGVVTLEDSLQYKIITEGNGPSPDPDDMVSVHYHGTFLDGEVFDSSVERGEPVQFPVNQVIPGWSKVLQLMKVGSKWQVWIPPSLAYGPRGNQAIPPNKMLVFEIELLDIVEE